MPAPTLQRHTRRGLDSCAEPRPTRRRLVGNPLAIAAPWRLKTVWGGSRSAPRSKARPPDFGDPSSADRKLISEPARRIHAPRRPPGRTSEDHHKAFGGAIDGIENHQIRLLPPRIGEGQASYAIDGRRAPDSQRVPGASAAPAATAGFASTTRPLASGANRLVLWRLSP